MAISISNSLNQSTPSFHPNNTAHNPFISSSFLKSLNPKSKLPSLSLTTTTRNSFSFNASVTKTEIHAKFSSDGGTGRNDNNNNNTGGRGGGGSGDNDDDKNRKKNRDEALMALAQAGKSLESLPNDMRVAVEDGSVPGSIVLRFFELEKSGFLKWLMQFGGFKERLLADDLFLAKVGIECGVGIFTQTAAEYERRRENFFNELEIVFADVVMAVIADFMLVYLPAPTAPLRAPLALNAGCLTKFLHRCPDNAFQVGLSGTSYSLLQRIGAIVRNGSKLFAVGTASSLVGTVATNALINSRKAVKHSAEEEVENAHVVTTSVAFGVYMAISCNLRYQVLAGVIEQRLLEPLLHKHKVFLSAISFAARAGNAYLGSPLWVDYARIIGLRRSQDLEPRFESNRYSKRDQASISPVTSLGKKMPRRQLNEPARTVQIGLVNISGCSYM